MYIESKLKEIDEQLFCLDLSAGEEIKIKIEDIEKQSPSWLRANSKIQYARGLFTVDSHFENERNLTDIFTIKGAYIQVSYLGKGDSCLVSSEERKAIGPGKIQCCYDCSTISHIEMPAFSPTHYQGIFLSKDYYLELLKNEPWVENSSFFKKVIQGDLIKLGACKFPINYRLYHILNQITRGDWEEDFKKYYIDLRLKELFLCLHLCQQESAKASNNGISNENIKKLEDAYAYLIENYRNPPTIKVLSRQVLLNELQLKKNFKIMYGRTIRGFIIELRMEKAQSLLGKYTVSEMAGILGYKSVPHFINTFKKYYGYTPKQGLKQ